MIKNEAKKRDREIHKLSKNYYNLRRKKFTRKTKAKKSQVTKNI